MNARHDVARRRSGAGGTPWRRRAARTAEELTVWPSLLSSPWMRRCPQRGFSRASRRMRASMSAGMVGRPPGFARRYTHLRRTSSRCHVRIVSGLNRRRYWSSRSRGPAVRRASAAARMARVSFSARVSRGGRGVGAAPSVIGAAARESGGLCRDRLAAYRGPDRRGMRRNGRPRTRTSAPPHCTLQRAAAPAARGAIIADGGPGQGQTCGAVARATAVSVPYEVFTPHRGTTPR
jgi:hypothetical protein